MNRAAAPISVGARVRHLAERQPELPAITMVDSGGEATTTTWGEFERLTDGAAVTLAARGVEAGSIVPVALPSCLEHFVACFGAFKLGACAFPMDYRLPLLQRDRLLELAAAPLAVAEWDQAPLPTLGREAIRRPPEVGATPVEIRNPVPGKVIGSGGSTGLPKVIVDPRPRVWIPDAGDASFVGAVGLRPGQIQLVPGALYHDAPFGWSHHGLFEANHLVVMERFDAAQVVELIEAHRVQFVQLAPTMMFRIARLPDIDERDLSSLEALFHTGGPCAPWLKRRWADLLPAEAIQEGYGSSEGHGSTLISGAEWLRKPGSVGRAFHDTEIQILGADGQKALPGETGDVYMRLRSGALPFEYRGAPAPVPTPDGYFSVGDLGWLDEDGYLFLADRHKDMIVSGGVNVYPAQVEAALSELEDVADVAVVGLPDEEWGQRVHAVIQAEAATAPSLERIEAHARETLAAAQRPKSYQFVASLPRQESGKLRRSDVRSLAEGQAADITPADD